MGTSFSAHVTGAFFMLLVGFGFYYVSWSNDLREQERWIQGNLAAFERQWQPAGGKMRIIYRAMDKQGFPFSSEIVLYSPSIRLKFPQASYTISAPSLNFSLEKDDRKEFSITADAGFNLEIKATNGAAASFDGYLSDKPPISLAAIVTQGQASVKGWNQYRLQIPENLQLTVSSLHRMGKVSLNGANEIETAWKNLPPKVDLPLRQLISVMQRTAK